LGRLLDVTGHWLNLDQMINLGVDQHSLDVIIGYNVQESWDIFIQPVLVKGRDGDNNGTQANAGMHGKDKLLRVCVHEDDVISWFHLDLVLQVHGNRSNLGVEFLPCDTLTFSTPAVDCAVRQLFWLASHTPLDKI
jgi:hypothetical protein